MTSRTHDQMANEHVVRYKRRQAVLAGQRCREAGRLATLEYHHELGLGLEIYPVDQPVPATLLARLAWSL